MEDIYKGVWGGRCRRTTQESVRHNSRLVIADLLPLLCAKRQGKTGLPGSHTEDHLESSSDLSLRCTISLLRLLRGTCGSKHPKPILLPPSHLYVGLLMAKVTRRPRVWETDDIIYHVRKW